MLEELKYDLGEAIDKAMEADNPTVDSVLTAVMLVLAPILGDYFLGDY